MNIITKQQAYDLGFRHNKIDKDSYSIGLGSCYLLIIFGTNSGVTGLHALDSVPSYQENWVELLEPEECTYKKIKKIIDALSYDEEREEDIY